MGKNLTKPHYLDTLFRVGEAIQGALRIDNWQNLLTGLGTSRDKTVYGRFVTLQRIDDQELTALYHQSADARKVVAFKPREMLRQGFRVNIPEDEEATAQLTKAIRNLKLGRHFLNGMIWGRLYGGAAAVLGVDDGGAADTPLREDRIKSFRFLHIVDRRYLMPQEYYDDPSEDEFFGQPEVYQLVPRRGGNSVRIHRSRMILFGGAHTSDEEKDRLGGWDYSILDVMYEELRAFWSVWKSAEHLMADASQAVFKLQGLMAMIAGGQKDVLQQRLEIVDMSRSVARAVMLDAENEDFDRRPSSFTDAAGMLDKFMLRLASVTDIPVTILMGRSPAGMNATGDSDFQHFYDNVKTAQENDLRPELERAIRLMMLAQDGPTGGKEPEEWTLDFESLWQMTPKEQAELEKSTADKDKLYLDTGVLLPEEVALNRFRPDGWSAETSIDREVRETVLAEELAEPQEAEPQETEPQETEPQEADATAGPKVEFAPTDLASFVNVNQALASVGLPPWPDAEEGALTVAQFRALKETQGEKVGAAEGAAEAKEIVEEPESPSEGSEPPDGSQPQPPPPPAPEGPQSPGNEPLEEDESTPPQEGAETEESLEDEG